MAINLGFTPNAQKETQPMNPVFMSSGISLQPNFQNAQIPAAPLEPPRSSSAQISFPQPTPTIDNSQAILAGVKMSLEQMQRLAEQYKAETEKPQELAKAEEEQKGFFSQIREASSKLLGIGQRRTDLESQYAVDENTKKLQENQLAIASKLAEYENAIKQVDALNVAKPFQDIERARAAKTYASEVGILEAYGNALQGNLTLANDRINQVLQNEYQSTQQEIDNLKMFYDINRDILTGEERKYAEQINARAQEQEAKLKEKQENESDNRKLFWEVAQNGGNSANIIDFNLPYEENLRRAQPYIGALDRAREARLGKGGIQASEGFGSYEVEQDFRQDAVALMDDQNLTDAQRISKLRKAYSPQEVSDSAINSFFGITPFGSESSSDIVLPGEFIFSDDLFMGANTKKQTSVDKLKNIPSNTKIGI